MESLCGIPRYIGYRLIGGPDLAPELPAFDVPDADGTVARRAGHDVGDLGVPGHGCDLRTLLAVVGAGNEGHRIRNAQVHDQHLPVASPGGQVRRNEGGELNGLDGSRGVLGKGHEGRRGRRFPPDDRPRIPDVNGPVLHPPRDQPERVFRRIADRPRQRGEPAFRFDRPDPRRFLPAGQIHVVNFQLTARGLEARTAGVLWLDDDDDKKNRTKIGVVENATKRRKKGRSVGAPDSELVIGHRCCVVTNLDSQCDHTCVLRDGAPRGCCASIIDLCYFRHLILRRKRSLDLNLVFV